MKRQAHLAEVEEVAIRVRVEALKKGRDLGTSSDVPGLVAEGRTVAETVEIAQACPAKSWNPASNMAIDYRRFSVPNKAQTKNFSCLQQFHNGWFVRIFLSRSCAEASRIWIPVRFGKAQEAKRSGGKRKAE